MLRTPREIQKSRDDELLFAAFSRVSLTSLAIVYLILISYYIEG